MRKAMRLLVLAMVLGLVMVADGNSAMAVWGDGIESAGGTPGAYMGMSPLVRASDCHVLCDSVEAQATEQLLLWENAELRAEVDRLTELNGNMGGGCDGVKFLGDAGDPAVEDRVLLTPEEEFVIGQTLAYGASLRHTLAGDGPTVFGKY